MGILKQARETLCSPVMQTGKIVRFLSSQKFGNNKFGNIQRRTFQLSEIVHPTVKLGNSIREYLEILCNSNYILLSVRVLSGTTSSTSSMSSSNVNMNLTAQQYYVTQEKGTERAFTGKYYDHHEKGTYICVCCATPLFSSETKYESGSGWP